MPTLAGAGGTAGGRDKVRRGLLGDMEPDPSQAGDNGHSLQLDTKKMQEKNGPSERA